MSKFCQTVIKRSGSILKSQKQHYPDGPNPCVDIFPEVLSSSAVFLVASVLLGLVAPHCPHPSWRVNSSLLHRNGLARRWLELSDICGAARHSRDPRPWVDSRSSLSSSWPTLFMLVRNVWGQTAAAADHLEMTFIQLNCIYSTYSVALQLCPAPYLIQHKVEDF